MPLEYGRRKKGWKPWAILPSDAPRFRRASASSRCAGSTRPRHAGLRRCQPAPARRRLPPPGSAAARRPPGRGRDDTRALDRRRPRQRGARTGACLAGARAARPHASDAASALQRLGQARPAATANPKVQAQWLADFGRGQLEAGQAEEAAVSLAQALEQIRAIESVPTPMQAEAGLALGRTRLQQERLPEALVAPSGAALTPRILSPAKPRTGLPQRRRRPATAAPPPRCSPASGRCWRRRPGRCCTC
jgi:hypothetical protein